MAKINRDVLMLREDQTPKVGASLSQSEPRKISMVGIKPHIPELNVKPCSDSEEEKGEIAKEFQNLAGLKLMMPVMLIISFCTSLRSRSLLAYHALNTGNCSFLTRNSCSY
ncbi:hypothetical protein Bca52824_096038 [Brassica carinata]|uniref:Uncharacterized protein n=1 Tax=Brassica carinata TaxID=52824 RepID=A0A8X7P119_BRACI|nr:hypothetical protein Bca52824_096038 [Brassica carinata]